MKASVARNDTREAWVARGRLGIRILVVVSAFSTLVCFPLWQANSSGGDTASESVGTAASAVLAISIPVLVLSAVAWIFDKRHRQPFALVLAAVGYVVVGAGAGIVLAAEPAWGYWPAIAVAASVGGTFVELRALVAPFLKSRG